LVEAFHGLLDTNWMHSIHTQTSTPVFEFVWAHPKTETKWTQAEYKNMARWSWTSAIPAIFKKIVFRAYIHTWKIKT
jgi:hypothetical protein